MDCLSGRPRTWYLAARLRSWKGAVYSTCNSGHLDLQRYISTSTDGLTGKSYSPRCAISLLCRLSNTSSKLPSSRYASGHWQLLHIESQDVDPLEEALGLSDYCIHCFQEVRKLPVIPQGERYPVHSWRTSSCIYKTHVLLSLLRPWLWVPHLSYSGDHIPSRRWESRLDQVYDQSGISHQGPLRCEWDRIRGELFQCRTYILVHQYRPPRLRWLQSSQGQLCHYPRAIGASSL